MQKSRLSRNLIAGLIFGFIVVLGLILLGDLQQVGSQFIGFQWKLYPLVILLTLFNYTLRGVKFHYYLLHIGADDIKNIDVYRIFVAGFPLAVTPGKIGEALKGVWIKHLAGSSAAKGISVVVAERISDGFAALILSIFGVIAYPQYWPLFTAVFLLLAGIVALSQFRSLVFFLITAVDRIKILSNFIKGLQDFYEGSYVLFKPVPTIIAISLGTFSWLGEGIGFYIILIGLGITPSLQVLAIAVFVLSFSTIVGAISTLPGGLGAAEASISGMLILLLGTSPDVAAAATLLIRFATLWFGVTLGLITWIFSRDLLGLKPPDQKPIGRDHAEI
jgi:uncharacterized protein (TIRG00374 family)